MRCRVNERMLEQREGMYADEQSNEWIPRKSSTDVQEEEEEGKGKGIEEQGSKQVR